MRFLIDAPVSRLIRDSIRGAGHLADHVNDVGLDGAIDARTVRRVRDEGCVVATQDTDYGLHLVAGAGGRPVSVVLFRMRDARPASQAAVLLANLAQFESDLESGAIVVLEDAGVRIRWLA